MKENDINIDTGVDVNIYKREETVKNIIGFKDLNNFSIQLKQMAVT